MLETLHINTASQTYPIYFTKNFKGLIDGIKSINKTYSRYVIITDDNVKALYGDEIKYLLGVFEKPVSLVSFEPGEASKTLSTIESFYSHLIGQGSDRKTLIVALGGGVTGDMAGYCAATYMRGLDFIQVPTTLLSQVDSSVGGKTGVDYNGYKNIVGAFKQPQLVYINVSTLKDLPVREFNAGMAEVIKHGFIQDRFYYDFLNTHRDNIIALEEEALIEMIKWSCSIKKSIVDQDETEQGIRGLLNFGHTLGHAIERLKVFEMIHGECVGVGMVGEAALANLLGYLSEEDESMIVDQIKSFNLPISVNGLNSKQVYDEMFYDKKTSGDRLVFAIVEAIGSSFLSKDYILESAVYQAMEKILK